MAYPTVSAPYGFKPINRVDGMPYAGATRSLAIANTAAAIYNGDLVQIVGTGTIERFSGTTTGSPAGVFMGCRYTNPVTKQPTYAQYWPANTAITDAVAYVVDDPFAAFQVAVTTAGSVMSFAYFDSIASNMAVVLGAGNANTGDSGMSILAGSQDTTAALPIRIIDVVPATAYISGGNTVYPEMIVKINLHQYLNTTGV
jgi:hypothetical protein